jgi:Protein of unknown function (DUF1186)/SEC-C motif
MNVDEALRQFAEAEAFPRAAMQWALDHWSEAAPRFLARLRAFAARPNRSDAVMNELFYVVHLCGEKSEERAYWPLCQLIAKDDAIVDLLGDGVTTTLRGVLVSVFDGDLSPLERAIESETGDEFARAAALEALGYLVRARSVLDDGAMRVYLRRLRREMKPRGESPLWASWAATAANLGYVDLRLDVATLNKDQFILETAFTLADFDRQARLAREDAAGLAGFAAEDIGPFHDAIETLSAWTSSGEDEIEMGEGEMLDGDGPPIEEPYVNPLREIGRNDPCPCGSGKKYKRCCLAS